MTEETEDTFDPKEYLQQGTWRDVKLGLHRTEELLERLGRPQDSLRIVHVAGTNGKGSTCAFIAGILQAAGYTTGLFTSPYILRFNERVQVNRQDISDADLYDVTVDVRKVAESMSERPTAFELITAVALLYFARVGCDVAVLEVGLGGRLDSTNVVEPLVCAITPVSLDHTHALGDTVEKIAAEKAGIIKKGVPVVCAAQADEAMKVIRKRAQEVEAPIVRPRFGRIHAHAEGFRQVFSYDGIQDVHLKLAGVYQPCNAVTAIEVVRLLRSRGFDISDEAIKAGLEATSWQGRFEVVEENPLVIVDGGHNVQGARALAASLREYFPQGGVNFSMSVLRDKRYRDMIAEVVPLARRFFCAEQHDNERALSAHQLAQAVCEVAKQQGIPVRLMLSGCGSENQASAKGIDALSSQHHVGDREVNKTAPKECQLMSDEECNTNKNISALGAGNDSEAYRSETTQSHSLLDVYVCTSVGEAACAARDAAAADGEGGVACCFGSLYAIADIMDALRER